MTEQPIKGNKALRVFLEPILCRIISNEDLWRLKVKYSIPCKKVNSRVLEYNPEAVIRALAREIVKSRYGRDTGCEDKRHQMFGDDSFRQFNAIKNIFLK